MPEICYTYCNKNKRNILKPKLKPGPGHGFGFGFDFGFPKILYLISAFRNKNIYFLIDIPVTGIKIFEIQTIFR